MKAMDAIARASQDREVAGLVEKGFFLVSAFASYHEKPIDEWMILYMSPDKKSVKDFVVKEDAIAAGEETPAMHESLILITDGIRFDEMYAIDTAKKDFGNRPMNTLVTLHNRTSLITWTVNFIMQDMTVTSYDIDAILGEIYNKKTTSIIKRL
jgi:hypothetical protein